MAAVPADTFPERPYHSVSDLSRVAGMEQSMSSACSESNWVCSSGSANPVFFWLMTPGLSLLAAAKDGSEGAPFCCFSFHLLVGLC